MTWCLAQLIFGLGVTAGLSSSVFHSGMLRRTAGQASSGTLVLKLYEALGSFFTFMRVLRRRIVAIGVDAERLARCFLNRLICVPVRSQHQTNARRKHS